VFGPDGGRPAVVLSLLVGLLMDVGWWLVLLSANVFAKYRPIAQSSSFSPIQ
jgi:hypothetical protein